MTGNRNDAFAEGQGEQLRLYSPEEYNFPRLKEPHEMSPEEFRNDPDTVFHANYLAFPQPGKKPAWMGQYHGIHAGTEQAAMERAAGMPPFYGDGVKTRKRGIDPYSLAADGQRGRSMVVHALNLRPYNIENLDNPVSDAAGNDKMATLGGVIRAYKNVAEDKGSTSVVIPEKIPGPMTHSHFVDAAIKAGLGHQVHPETMMAYQAGDLDTYQKTSGPEAMEVTRGARDSSPSLFPYVNQVTGSLHSREEVARMAGRDPDDPSIYTDVTAQTPAARYNFGQTLAKEAKENTQQDYFENQSDENLRTALSASHLAPVGESLYQQPKVRISNRGDIRKGRQFDGIGE